jgi:hypothetical protein
MLAVSPASAGTLMSVSPAGASAAVTIQITGTGFDPTANNNEVSFIPAAGATQTARGTSIVLVNASSGTRRLAVVVPPGLPTGHLTLRVRNTVTQETSEGQSLDLIAISLPQTTSGARGASNLSVRIDGSSNTQFVQGVTRATFGAGITVVSTTVQSPTSLVATISISATAALGPRTAGVITNTQTALVDGFQVVDGTGPPNHDPSISSSPVTTATVAQPYAYDVDATDADAGDTLTYSLTQAPGGMTINAATGLIAWTPSATQVPSASVAVRVVDGKGGTATQAFTIAVAQGNRPPAFTSTPKTAASEGRDYSYQATASDPDGDALTFSLTTAPAGMTIGATGLIAWKPASTQTGSSPVTVRVADAAGASATQAFTIVVAANTPPAIGSTPPTTGTEASAYRYDVAATDADGDPLTYALLQSPAGMTIGPSGRIDWIPRADQTTGNPVSLEVRDDRGGRTTQTFTVTVAATNHPPRIDSAPVTTAREQLPYSYQVHATDPNGDSIAYALAAAPQGMTIDAASGLIAWTPPHSPPPSVHVAVIASDGAGGTDTQTFDITVTAAPKTNQAPRITSTPVTTAHTTERYVYDVRADDPDAGDTLTFALVQPPTGMTIDAASGHVAWTPAAAQTGPFAVTVLVSDGTDAVQQAFEVTVTAAQTTNRPPSAHAGGPYQGEAGAQIAFSGNASSDPDGDPLSFSWSFGDGSAAATGATPSHIYAEAGSFVVTLTVSDGHGGESARSTTAAIGAAGDRSPPSVTLIGPREVLPGDQITLTAQAIDNVRVDTVTFEVDGANPTETSTEPFQRAIVVPAVASPGTQILVKATATDPSGNTGSAEATLTINARPDTEKPTIRLNAPTLASPGTSLHLSASADDNSGIQSVNFSINGASLVTLTQPPYEVTYDIPPDTPVGSALAAGAFALDFSANRSDAAAAINIVETPDTVPPTVVLTAGATVAPGAVLSLTASAFDGRGVSKVDFYVDGVKISSDTQAPYAAAFPVPENAQAGRSLQLEARAVDFSGLEGTDSRQALIISASSLADGVMTGEVYDDTSGLPVAGATITLTGVDAGGRDYSQSASSDSRGRYLLHATEGAGILRVARDGWTRVDRSVDIVANRSINVIDARLTPLTPTTDPISAVLGGTSSGPAGSHLSLSIAPGALTASTAVAVTPIGSQGLQGLLPPGWSPVATADIAPHDLSFAAPATLTQAVVSGLPNGAHLVLARWDEATAEWRALLERASAGGALASSVDRAGQYAWLLADTTPVAPPTPTVGAALSGVTPAPIPADATTTVTPQSKIVFYQPGIRTDVTGAVAPASPLSSGSLIFTRISESYKFTSGQEAHLEPYVEDLVLFQASGGPSTLTARYTVTPSIAFEPVTLQSGVITVELFEPQGSRVSDVIGAGGGSVTADTGERVVVPANGLSTPAAVTVRALTPSDLDFVLPSAFTMAGGLTVSASGAQFTGPVTLSIPAPPQLPPGTQILIARIADVGTTSRLVLVALGQLAGDRIESSTSLGQDPNAFEGARAAGRYLFLRPSSPVGFASGVVHAVNGDPFAGALVSADTLPLFALSRSTGQYVAAASIGAVSLLALDTLRNDTGSGQGTIAGAASILPIDLRLSAQAPHVLSITPADQAANVPLSNPIVVTFSEPLNPASITPASVVVTGPEGTPVSGTLALSNGNAVVTFRPAVAFAAETSFTVTVAAAISDLSGYTLGQAVTSRFTSLDVTAPPPPPAGAINASIPGADGTTTVTGTQGTAGPHDTVSIINQTRGTTTPVLLNPSGGFSAIVAAGLNDQLKLRIVDAAGNVTVVDLPLFTRTNADGSVSAAVGAAGGKVEGPGGVSASIKPGTFPAGAIVTIKPVTEAEFPVTMTPDQRAVFGYAGGVTLDFGGQVPTQYVNVAVPPGLQDRPDNQWVVGLVSELKGQQVLNVVDTAKLIDGKVTTSSPPCPGVMAAGVYGIFKSARMLGLTYGTATTTVGDIVASVDVPFAALPFLSPLLFFSSDLEIPLPMCLPVLSGRVTVVSNSVTITVPRAQLGTSVSGLTVKNITQNTETQFGRAAIAFTVTVHGDSADTYKVLGTVGSESKPMPFKVLPGLVAGTADVVLGIEALTLFPSEITVRNLTHPERDPENAPTPGDALQMTVGVTGGFNDRYSVHADDPTIGGCCPARFAVHPSAVGEGDLVASALPGTIDPTRAEIEAFNAAHPNDPPLTGPGRTKVEVVSKNGSLSVVSSVEVPAAQITNGGFKFAFDGDVSLRFSVKVSYEDGSTNTFEVPMFRVTVSNPDTGEVIKSIVLPSPPADQPLNLGRLTNDKVPPQLTNDLTGLSSFDPASDLLTFTFSEPLDADSVKNNALIIDAEGHTVHGTFRLSAGNTVLTFVPDDTLALGVTYTVIFRNVTDRGGNQLPPSSRILEVNTTAPRLVGSLETVPGPAGIRDLRLRTSDVPGEPSVLLLATTDSKLGNSLIAINVGDPARPAQVGKAQAGFFKREMTLAPNVSDLTLAGPSPCAPQTSTFSGDLVATTSWTVDFTYVSFFNVTNPSAPCLMANKLLTASPDSELFSVSEHGTYHLFGAAARGVATIVHSQGIASYSAIAEAGLFAVDIGPNIPEKPNSQRQTEAMLPGNYYDVVADGGRLLALNRSANQLEIIDPTFAVLGVLPLPDSPRRLVLSKGFPFDANGNGELEEGEAIDAVFIAGDKNVSMVDVTDLQAPRIVGVVSMPAPIQALDVSRQRRQLAAIDGQNSMYVVDLSKPSKAPFVDINADGIDDRIAWTRRLGDTPYAVKWDDRPYIYVGTARGLEAYAFGTPNLSGTARYTFYPAIETGIVYPDPGIPAETRAIRGAIVELRRASGDLLQTSTTDGAGFYSFDAPLGVDLKVVVKAALGRPNDIHLDVVDNTNSNSLHTVSSETFSLGSGGTKHDVLAETVWTPAATPGGLGKYTKRAAAPFAILDTIFEAEKVVRRSDPTVQFPMLHVGWSEKNVPALAAPLPGEDVGRINVAAGFLGPSPFYSPVDGAIYLRGKENWDTDEYDAPVVRHEWSHYLMDKFGRNDSVGRAHSPGDQLDPRVAFNEGFATANGAMLANDSLYVDTSGANQGGSFNVDIEKDNNGHSGFFSEDGVQELLWDLYDPKSEHPEFDEEQAAALPPDPPGTITLCTTCVVQDDVELPYGPFYRAMRAQKTSLPFVTIFSYLKSLLGDPEVTAADRENIGKLAKAENIDLTAADEYEMSPHDLYTVIPVNGDPVATHQGGKFKGQPLQTRLDNDPNGDNNKFLDQVFFKFTVDTAGPYEFEVKPAAAHVMRMTLLAGSSQQTVVGQAGAPGATVKLSGNVPAGTFSIAVEGLSGFRSDGSGIPANAQFTIRITPGGQ